MLRRRQLMAMQTGGLPKEYRQVEYLASQSNGGQYIDTNVLMPPIAENAIVCKGKFSFGGTVAWESAFGAKGTEFCIQRYSTSNTLSVQVFGVTNSGVYSITDSDTDGIEFELSKNLCIINGTNAILNAGNVHYNGFSIWLFGKMAAGSTNIDVKGNVFIYWFQILDNGVLVRDFIPCVRKSDSKPGMYDTVSKTFYINAGSGEFIVPA